MSCINGILEDNQRLNTKQPYIELKLNEGQVVHLKLLHRLVSDAVYNMQTHAHVSLEYLCIAIIQECTVLTF